MNDTKSGSRTLLMSVLMSAPGPLVLAIGLTAGHSSTQLADFFRRSAELLAIICSFVVYGIIQRNDICNSIRKKKLETGTNLFVGVVMCISGIIMVGLALFFNSEDKGNVIGGLVIALMGMVANTLFWKKYSKLNRASPNAILAVQGRLYRVKAMVDTCVTVALSAVVLFPTSAISAWLDCIGSIVVAIYLILCGIKTIRESAACIVENVL